MYEVVLVTFGESMVKSALELCPDVLVIDCRHGREAVLEQLERAMEKGVRNLLTYRCPYIIPEPVFNRALAGAYNIHPTMLPAYPGMNPWQQIFEDGVKESGVTLHRMSVDVDAGEIVAQLPFHISDEDDIMSARHKSDTIALSLVNSNFSHIK